MDELCITSLYVIFTTFSARRLINWKVPWTGCRLWMQPSRLGSVSVLFPRGPCFGTKFRRLFPAGISKMMEHRSDDFPWKRVVFFAPDIRYQPFEMYPWSWGHEKIHKHIHFDDMFESHVWSHFGIRNLQVLPTSQAIYYIYVIYMVFLL